MKLSAQLIVYHLRQSFPLTASSWLSYEPHLEYPVFYQSPESLADGKIYLTDDPDFLIPSHHLSKTLVILTGGSHYLEEEDYPNLCILKEIVSPARVLSVLQEIFQKYEKWNQELFQLILEQSSVQKLIDATEMIIPNPMAVIGLDFTLIASRDYPDPDTELKDGILGSTEETQHIVNSLKHDINYTEAQYRTGYFYYPGNHTAPPSLCVNIRRSGKTGYRLLIRPGEIPLDDTFGFIAEHLASLISHILSTKAVPERDALYPLHQIFYNLLTNPKADYVEISRQLTENGWMSAHSYQCILIKTGILDWKNLTLKSICSYIENSIPASCALEHRGNVVVYINLNLCDLTLDEISQKLAGFIRDSLLNAGYSRVMLGHFNFQRQYVQASISIQVGSRKNPTSWIHHFNDIALPYILEQITSKLPAYMICHEKLLKLKYQDEETDSQLYETLRAYLQNQQSATKTAAALYIHRSTFLYRLEKIEKLLKSDLSDPDEQLYLMLSFYLMDQEERSKK